jgi:DNA-binding transcriptional regulator YiaG
MAERGRVLPNAVQIQIRRLRLSLSVRKVARLTGTSSQTVQKYGRTKNTN